MTKLKIRNRCGVHGARESSYPNMHMCRLFYDVVQHLTKSSGFNLDPVQTAALTIELVYSLMEKNKRQIIKEGLHVKYHDHSSNHRCAERTELDTPDGGSDLSDDIFSDFDWADIEKQVCGAL